jgi:hypothetical protein
MNARRVSIALLVLAGVVGAGWLVVRMDDRLGPLTRPNATHPAAIAPAGRADAPKPATGGEAGAIAPLPWGEAEFAGIAAVPVEAPCAFRLPGGVVARGVVRRQEVAAGRVGFVGGELTEPEAGTFFFHRQEVAGKAGPFIGVVEFPGTARAYRLEPDGAGGSRLVARHLTEVRCVTLPPPGAEPLIRLSPSDHPTNVPELAYQNSVPALESLPGSLPVVYLDYDGAEDAVWGSARIDAASPNATDAQIREVWERVSEDFLPFNINVTTDLAVFERAPKGSRIRCIVTPTTTASPGSGGVAYVGSFNWTSDTVCWSFYSSGQSASVVISHEVGHTLGLSHDGTTTSEYYGGHGSGALSWGPIMGSPYGRSVTQWSRGQYTNANRTQDDLAIIANNNNNVDHRADAAGSGLAGAAWLDVLPGGTVTNEGIIETTNDVDAFRFTLLSNGTMSLGIRPAAQDANLALFAELSDETGSVLMTNASTTALTAALATNLPPGTYTVAVRGSGRGNAYGSGFAPYGSLGYYRLTGVVTGCEVATRFSVAENSSNGTLVGTVPVPAGATNPVIFSLVSGNTSNLFALATNGTLTVASAQYLNHERIPRVDLFTEVLDAGTLAPVATNQRVVVTVQDVDERPVAAGTNVTVFAGMATNVAIAMVLASDPDDYSRVVYAITSDPTGIFRVAPDTGVLTLGGALAPATQSLYAVAVSVYDPRVPGYASNVVVNVSVLPHNAPMPPGRCTVLHWDGIGGSALVSGLTSASTYPNTPTSEDLLTSAEGLANRADNYGTVLRGYLIPPVTGAYRLFIASDDASELWVTTTTATNGLQRIANVASYTSPRDWTATAAQQSTNRNLTAGQAFYFEVRHKEGGGDDHVAIAWECTNGGVARGVIPGSHMAPYRWNYAPRMTNHVFTIHRGSLPATFVGQMRFTDVDVEDTNHTWAIASGNGAGLFSVDAAGVLRVADTNGLLGVAGTNAVLGVRVADTNVPSLGVTGTVTLVLRPAGFVTTNVYQEVWTNLTGTTIAALTTNARYPGRATLLSALTSLDGPYAGDNYGSRMRVLLVPTNTGPHTFYIASDDASELRFTPGTNGDSAPVIAFVSTYTSDQVWNTYTSQQSAPIALTAGSNYYLEVRQKEGGGGDHATVGWLTPGATNISVVPRSVLRGIDLNFAPWFTNQTRTVAGVPTNGQAIAYTAAIDAQYDSITYALAGGNVGGTFALDPVSGTLRVTNQALIASGARSVFELVLRAQDNGAAGLFPPRSTDALIRVQCNGQTQTPYEAWAAAIAPAWRARDLDPDLDGLNNLFEFGTGGHGARPDAGAIVPRIEMMSVGSNLMPTFTFRRRILAGGVPLTYAVETTTNLNLAWIPAEGTLTGSPVPAGDGVTEWVTFQLSEPFATNVWSRFIRLRVTESYP